MALVSALAMAMPLAVIQPTTASTASSATTGAAPQSSSFQADPLMLADTGSGSGLSAPPAPNPYSETFTLHSDPGAPDVIYLDFVGYNGPVEPNSDPGTDTPYDLDGDPSTFSDAEMDVIQNVWARVAENFAPFDVDVTTAAPGDELFTSGDGVRVDITNGGTSALATTCGGSSDCVGEAWTSGWGELDPAAVVLPQHFGTGNAGNPEEIAEVATHEIGHTLGLEHDVTSTNSSLSGAVMDPAYQDTPLKQWTSTPAGTQSLPTGGDELAIIETTLAPKSDGYGQSFAQATPLAGVSFDVSGTITADTQTDWFSFTVPSGAGPLNLDVAPSQYSSMLDIDATLFDSSDNQLVDSDPPATFVSPSEATGLDAPFTDVSLSPGTYYLRVEGSGGPGYTSYGSIGTYTITGGFAVACTPGTYSSTGDQPCTDAPVGSYVSGTGNTSATPCPAGSYTDQTGQVGCTDAPPGSYDAGTGNTSATLCPVGTFNSNAGQSSCTDAPPGSFASGTGNTSATLCPAGDLQLCSREGSHALQLQLVLTTAGQVIPRPLPARSEPPARQGRRRARPLRRPWPTTARARWPCHPASPPRPPSVPAVPPVWPANR